MNGRTQACMGITRILIFTFLSLLNPSILLYLRKPFERSSKNQTKQRVLQHIILLYAFLSSHFNFVIHVIVGNGNASDLLLIPFKGV